MPTIRGIPHAPALSALAEAASARSLRARLWAHSSLRAGSIGSRIAPSALIVVGVLLLSWHALAIQPQPGQFNAVGATPANGIGPLGRGWEAALHMALHYDVTFGDNLIFTYGPLGFLSAPTLWYSDTGTIAFLYTLLLRVGFAAAVFTAARRSYGTLAGAAAALLVADASGTTYETVPFLIFIVWLVTSDLPRRRLLALMALGGAVAGLELLNKASIGLEITALALTGALVGCGRRFEQLIVTIAGMAAGLLGSWAVTGQDVGALPDFVRYSEQIVTGYAAAMGFESSSLILEFPAAAVAAALGVAAARHMNSGRDRRTRAGIVCLWLVFCFFQFKEGFVRHAADHGASFFVALLGGFLALRWRRESRTYGALALALLLIFAVTAQKIGAGSLFDPAANARAAVEETVKVLIPSRRNSTIAKGRRAIQRAFPIDAQTLALLRGHTVHVMPFQTAVIWGYRLGWAPLPVFQSYSAYTSSLDDLNADTLTSPRAPQRILRSDRNPEIDRRLEAFDEGLTTRTILCRYRELRITSTWQVLGQASNRCLPAAYLGSVHAAWGQRVRVPPPPTPQSFVFVNIGGVDLTTLERTLAVPYKPPSRFVRLDGRERRLVEGTARDGVVLRAAPGVDFRAPFNFAPDRTTIAVRKTALEGGGRPITYSFYAVQVSEGARSAASTTAVGPSR